MVTVDFSTSGLISVEEKNGRVQASYALQLDFIENIGFGSTWVLGRNIFSLAALHWLQPSKENRHRIKLGMHKEKNHQCQELHLQQNQESLI